MRKALLAAGLAALMAMPVMAEDVATLAEKIDRVDQVHWPMYFPRRRSHYQPDPHVR